MQSYIKIILRGISQVMLQNNALTGLLFLAGIFYNSWLMGLGAILGNIVSTISAVFFKYSKEDIKNGLYGFNGTLVGVAIWFYFEASAITVFAIIFGAILSTFIMYVMKKKIPAFTMPFVISAWVVIYGLKLLNLSSLKTTSLPQDIFLNLPRAVSMGFGQIMLQDNIITGLFFLLAIIINSRLAAIYAFYGSLFGSLLAVLFSLPLTSVNIGLFGYNAVLCSIALADKKWSAFLLATLAVGLSVLLNFGFNKFGIISLTAPFVLATWAALLIKKYLIKK